MKALKQAMKKAPASFIVWAVCLFLATHISRADDSVSPAPATDKSSAPAGSPATDATTPATDAASAAVKAGSPLDAVSTLISKSQPAATPDEQAQLVQAQKMADTALAALKNFSPSTADAATPAAAGAATDSSGDDSKAAEAQLAEAKRMVQAAMAALQSSSTSPASAADPKEDPEAKALEDAFASEARTDFAKAKAMADEALAAQPDPSSELESGPVPSVSSVESSSPITLDSLGDALSQTGAGSSNHHGMDELTSPKLNINSTGEKHNTMSGLF